VGDNEHDCYQPIDLDVTSNPTVAAPKSSWSLDMTNRRTFIGSAAAAATVVAVATHAAPSPSRTRNLAMTTTPTRYLSRHGSKNVIKAGLVATVVPGLAKSKNNPNGVDPTFFDGLKDSLRKDRATFLSGLLKDVFYAFLRA
jgi:hypothetical protein